MRIGLGYDLHRLTSGRPLILGGVRIPFSKGLLGHSDGDALIHAIIDALLGARGQGDIGRLFPDTEDEYRNARSVDLLTEVAGRLRADGFRTEHVDAVIIAERPKLGLHFEAMKDVLAPVLGLRRDRLGLKAKTNEGLGDIGKGRAIACFAVASLRKIPKRRTPVRGG